MRLVINDDVFGLMKVGGRVLWGLGYAHVQRKQEY
jgi:hypothetical protein